VIPVERTRSPSVEEEDPFTLPHLPGQYRRSGSSSIASKSLKSTVPSTITSQLATSSIASSKLRQTPEPELSDFEFPDSTELVEQARELRRVKTKATEIKLEKLEQQEACISADTDGNTGTNPGQPFVNQAIEKGHKRSRDVEKR
jgi:hypothetical protein